MPLWAQQENVETCSLQNASTSSTKLAGIHDTLIPPPNSFAFELLGLLSHSTLHNNKTYRSSKLKTPACPPLPFPLCSPEMGHNISRINGLPSGPKFQLSQLLEQRASQKIPSLNSVRISDSESISRHQDLRMIQDAHCWFGW